MNFLQTKAALSDRGKQKKPVPFLGAACRPVASSGSSKMSYTTSVPSLSHYPFVLALGRDNKETAPKTNAESYHVADVSLPSPMLLPLPQIHLMHLRCCPLACAPHLPKPCLLCTGCMSSFSKGACTMIEGLGKFLSFPSGI